MINLVRIIGHASYRIVVRGGTVRDKIRREFSSGVFAYPVDGLAPAAELSLFSCNAIGTYDAIVSRLDINASRRWECYFCNVCSGRDPSHTR